MRQPQFRIRTLMIAVAVAASSIHRRSVRFQALSVLHQHEQAKVLLTDLEIFLLFTEPQVGPGLTPSQYEKVRKRIDQPRLDARPMTDFIWYHEQLADKYERAARRPWLPVAPDPPQPPQPTMAHQKAFRARYANWLEEKPQPRRTRPTATANMIAM